MSLNPPMSLDPTILIYIVDFSLRLVIVVIVIRIAVFILNSIYAYSNLDHRHITRYSSSLAAPRPYLLYKYYNSTNRAP